MGHLLDGSPSEVIAKDLGVSVEHARVVVMRTRRHARAILDELGWDPGGT